MSKPPRARRRIFVFDEIKAALDKGPRKMRCSRAIRLTIGSRSFAQSRGVFLVGLEEPLERSGVWMCFRPKSRASIDQAPGPTIAKLTPRTPSMIGIHGSPGCEKAPHSSTMAINAPTSGVHKPTRRRVPAPAPMICGATGPT